MKQLLCATGNPDKFGFGKMIMADYGIDLVQQPVEMDEIQGENPEVVLKDKVMKAYEALQQPVVVSDDWWDFPALGGFPGAYMKSINHWLTPEDFIALMAGKTDRRVYLHAFIAYYDGSEFRYYGGDYQGIIVDAPRGQYGPSVMKVAAMDTDGGKTISEVYDAGQGHAPARVLARQDAWKQLGNYLQEKDA